MSPDGQTRTTIANDELINPTGLEIGADGDIYISNKGFVAGQGEVLRLSLSNEPVYDYGFNIDLSASTSTQVQGSDRYGNSEVQSRGSSSWRSDLLSDRGMFDYSHDIAGGHIWCGDRLAI